MANDFLTAKPITMKKYILLVCITFAFFGHSFGQKSTQESLPLSAEYWESLSGEVRFEKDNEISKMILTPESGKVVVKDFDFNDGTIEFTSHKTKALSFFFRMKDENENEYFYLRTARGGDPTAMDAFQYAPTIKGVLMWNTYPQFQSNATYSLEGDNHFKFVIAGSRMQIFINSDTPTLEVDHLEGNYSSGRIGFEGEVEISNFKITRDTEGLISGPALDPTAFDPRYIRDWAVSEAVDIPGQIDFSYEYLPTPETKWTLEKTERRGFLNLTRKFGKIDGKRLNWLKVKIDSEMDQTKTMDLGFLTEVWVFLNGQLAFLDKNLEGRLMAKKPDGRISVENASVLLLLKEGANELIIGIANTAWGTGAMARFEDLKGIKVSPDPNFDHKMIALPKESLKAFEGEYLIPGYNEELLVTSDEYSLIMKSPVFNGTALPKSKSVFFVRGMELDIQFSFDSNNQVTAIDFIVEGASVLKLDKKKD